MRVDLIRVTQTRDATYGVLLVDGIPRCLTLEPPWRDNEPFFSCIPTGQYVCEQINSPRFGLTWQVCNVKNRTHILFHKGNQAGDTRGCIVLGEDFRKHVNGEVTIGHSKIAFEEFLEAVSGLDSFDLMVKRV